MSDTDFDDEDFEQELLKVAVNREVQETTTRQSIACQRTLTGERLDPSAPTYYEEIQKTVTFRATHHEMDKDELPIYIYPSNLQMRDYQFDIIQKALYKNLLCAIPTGMGKTFIASTVMLNFYRWFPKGKIIFMAPTRPLVAQQIKACLGCTDIKSSDTAILLDKMRKNRPEIWNNKRVFFTTPQVVENDLKAGTLDPKEIVCVVIDEAHRATGNYAYTNVVKFIDRFNTSFRVLALTATPASDIKGVQEVVNNLNISSIEIRTEDSIDISRYMKRKETVRINVGLNAEMQEIIEMLSVAIDPILKQANEANIYDITDPGRINFFIALQKSTAIRMNRDLNEGLKWKYIFMLKLIGQVGQMLRRLKIYSIRSFFTYFQNQLKIFKSKYELGKSTDKLAATFFYHESLLNMNKFCQTLLSDRTYIPHPKLERMQLELESFFEERPNSRVIIFTELRDSALEIVQFISSNVGGKCRSHIFIGQSGAKESFDEEDYKLKNSKKGRGAAKKAAHLKKVQELQEEKDRRKIEDAAKRAVSRTGTSEEAQIQGMNQKKQKEVIQKFKNGDFNIIVATSIGEEGLDIGEVDLIICYDSTSSPIKNIQRMGRTGRKNDGKVILLLAPSEELKFDQAMDAYSRVQHQIASNDLELHKSDRMIPSNITPKCSKELIKIPEENLIIARGQDEDEVIKYATQAMLSKTAKTTTKRRAAVQGKSTNATMKVKGSITDIIPIKKRFFMPDDVQTGFVQSSELVRKVDSQGNSVPRTLSKLDRSVSIDLSSDDSDLEINQLKESTTPNTTSLSDNHILKRSNLLINESLVPKVSSKAESDASARIITLDILEGIFDESDENEIPLDRSEGHLKTVTNEYSGLTKDEKAELDELADLENGLTKDEKAEFDDLEYSDVSLVNSQFNPDMRSILKSVMPDSKNEKHSIEDSDELTKGKLEDLDAFCLDDCEKPSATKLLHFSEKTKSNHNQCSDFQPVDINHSKQCVSEGKASKVGYVPDDFGSFEDEDNAGDPILKNPHKIIFESNCSIVEEFDNEKNDEKNDEILGSDQEEEEDDFFKNVIATLGTMKKNNTQNNEVLTQSQLVVPGENILNEDAFLQPGIKEIPSLGIFHQPSNSLPTASLLDFTAYEETDSTIGKIRQANEKQDIQNESYNLNDDHLKEPPKKKRKININSSRVQDKTNDLSDIVEVLDMRFDKANTVSFANQGNKIHKRQSLKSTNTQLNSPKTDITNLLKERCKPYTSTSLRRCRFALSTTPNEVINLEDEEGTMNQNKSIKKHTTVNLDEEDKLMKDPFNYMSQQDHAFPITFVGEEGFLTLSQRNEFFSEFYTSAQADTIVPNPSNHIRNTRELSYKIKHSDVSDRFINFSNITGSKEAIRLKRLSSRLLNLSEKEYDNTINIDDIIVQEDNSPIILDQELIMKKRIDLVSQTFTQRINSLSSDDTFLHESYDIKQEEDLINYIGGDDDDDYRFL